MFFFYQKVKDTKTVVVLLNAVGSWSQLFYLPLIKVGFTLANWSHTMFIAYAVSFVLMVATSILGCKISISYCEIKKK